jgi:alanine racemase
VKYTIDHICHIVEGEFRHFFRDDAIEQVLTDSRKLIFPEATLFFALRGPRRDGHQFVRDLYTRDVRNFIMEAVDAPVPLPDANVIIVKNTLVALQQLAAFHRSRFDIPVIGVTGSNGKTIVKEWLNQLLANRFNIVRSPRSYNSQTGVPLSVWQMNDTHELAIFEAGISLPGEMQKLEKIIRPNIGVFTNIGEAHAENFTGIGNKSDEKARLFRSASVIIYPADDDNVSAAIERLLLRENNNNKPPVAITWGYRDGATVKVKEIKKENSYSVIRVEYAGQVFSVDVPFIDQASVENAITCVCVLLHFNIPFAAIGEGILRLSPVAMRLELKSGINHCSVINDSYSADLSSLKIALDFLEQQQQHSRRTVILSDILQSDKNDHDLYEQVAAALKQKNVDRLVGIGERIGANREIFFRYGIAQTSFYPSTDAFKKDFYQLFFRDETILIKGARVFEFEKIDSLLAEHIHQTVLEINLDAMTHNLKQYQRLLKPATKLMAMVKAFAYGSGTFEIANLLQFHKVDYLAVAYADEGVELRKAGINLPVMVMNTEDSSFDALVQYNLQPVIYSPRLLWLFDQFLKQEGLQQFPVHIEVETGMNRLGFATSEIPDLLAGLKNTCFRVQTVFSHLAASEEPQQDEFTRQQAAKFMDVVAQLQQTLDYPFLTHISNSAAIERHPELQYDMVRLGIGLYGIGISGLQQLDLQEVSTLKSTIAQIRYLEEGETVGYNRKGVATGRQLIATVGIGYADGYPRSLGNGNGKMWVNGHLAPVSGSVCMDMTMIDITGIPDVHEGDEVVVFGNELSVRQLAHWAQTIPYEILTGISQRVKRIYFES